MTLANPKTRYTPDDLLRLEGEGLFELVDGKPLVEKKPSSVSSRTTGIIAARLFNCIEASGSGDVIYLAQTFQCFAHETNRVRRPDLALVPASRVEAVPEEGHVPIAPDLVVEVISPSDNKYAFEEKLEDYQMAGVKVVWEVNPKFRFVRVHHPDRNSHFLMESDTLTGDPVLPTFSVLVKELLPPVSRNHA
jgi:Uma2 family endonuclease